MIHFNKTFFQFAKHLALIVLLIGMSSELWASESHSTHYSKATITTNNGKGKVYVTSSQDKKPDADSWHTVTEESPISEATKNCGGYGHADDSHVHQYYFYAEKQAGFLWAGWEKDKIYIDGTAEDKLIADSYYYINQSVEAKSDNTNTYQRDENENWIINYATLNLKARWWTPTVTNAEIVEDADDGNKYTEEILVNDPGQTNVTRTIKFYTAEALSASNFTLSKSAGITTTDLNPNEEEGEKYKNEYKVTATIPLTGINNIPDGKTHTITLTSQFKGNNSTPTSATATIIVKEDYTPKFGWKHDKIEFLHGGNEQSISLDWLNKSAEFNGTIWETDLTGDGVFEISAGEDTKSPTIKYNAPENPDETYTATLTIYCTYPGKQDDTSDDIESNIIDAQGNEIIKDGEVVHRLVIPIIATTTPTITFSPNPYDFGTIKCGSTNNHGTIQVQHNLRSNITFTPGINNHEAIVFEWGEFDDQKRAQIEVQIGETLPVGQHTATLRAEGTDEKGNIVSSTLTVTVNVILNDPILWGTPSNNQVNLRWDRVPGATEYIIKKRNDTTSEENEILIENPETTSYYDTDVTNGQPYTYTLVANCKSGSEIKDTKTSNTITIIPQYRPTFIAKNQTSYTDGEAVAANNTGLYTGPLSGGNRHELNVSAAFAGDDAKFDWLYLFVAETQDYKYPCYIYKKDNTKRYKYDGQVEMTDVNKDNVYFDLSTGIGSIYLTGYCAKANTGNYWYENGLLSIKKGNSNEIHIYADSLHLEAKEKTSSTHKVTDGDALVGYINSHYPMGGSGAILVFDATSGSFDAKLHIRNNNSFHSTTSMNLQLAGDAKLNDTYNLPLHMTFYQEASVIKVMVNSSDQEVDITIDDEWHDINNATNTLPCHVNGKLVLKNPKNFTDPLINLGCNGRSLSINGGQIFFDNEHASIAATYKPIQRTDSKSSYTSTTIVYGSNGYIKNEGDNNATMTALPAGTPSIHFSDGTIDAAKSPLVCPDGTKIDGGSYLCDIKTGNAEEVERKGFKAYPNKNSADKTVYRIAVDITESVGTIDNGLAVFKTELIDGIDGFQVLMDNIFPMANYKMTNIDGKEYYAPLSSYYNSSTNYGHNSLAPEGTKVYLMLPQDGEIETYVGWSLCTPEVKRLPNVIAENDQNNNGGDIEINEVGGSLDVTGTSKDPIPVGYKNGEGIKITNRLLYTEIDQVTKQVAEILDPENPEEPADTDLNDNVILGHHVTNEQEYTINEKVYMLLPVVAGEWRMIVAPFDVHNVYAIESYPENMLKKVYGEEKRAGSGRYYITDIEGAQNAQARRLLDLLVYWMGYENLDTDFFGAAGGYGPFVNTWMNYEASAKEQKNGGAATEDKPAVEGDFTPIIEQLYHFTGQKGSYPDGMKWYDANYYLYKSAKGSWELNNETGIVKTDWEEVTEQSTPRTEGTPNVIMQKGGFYSMQFPSAYTSDGWDYWNGKYILLEGYGPQTIDGSSTINTLINQNITAPTSGVQLYGNGSFAKSGTLTHEHLYHIALPETTDENGETVTGHVHDFVRYTDTENLKTFGPIEGFAIGNLDATTLSMNDEGQIVQTQKIAKAIKMETGEVMYEVKTEILDDNPGLGSGVPTIMNGMSLIVEPTAEGLTITPLKEQHVMLFDAEGKMIFSKYMSEEESVSLPTGVYVVRGEYEQVKAIKK